MGCDSHLLRSKFQRRPPNSGRKLSFLASIMKFLFIFWHKSRSRAPFCLTFRGILSRVRLLISTPGSLCCFTDFLKIQSQRTAHRCSHFNTSSTKCKLRGRDRPCEKSLLPDTFRLRVHAREYGSRERLCAPPAVPRLPQRPGGIGISQMDVGTQGLKGGLGRAS